MVYKRYQIDLVELSRELNMNGKSKYLLTWVDHFSKYACALPIKNKDVVTVQNTIAQVFIRRYSRILQKDSGKEFVNKALSAYLDRIKVEHVVDAPYHPQSQGAIEVFNKTVQKALSKAYDNTKKIWKREIWLSVEFVSIPSLLKLKETTYHNLTNSKVCNG